MREVGNCDSAWQLGDSCGTCLGVLEWDVVRCHVSVCNNADLPNAVCADMPPPWCRSVVGTSMAEYKDAVHDAEQFILHDVEMFNGERWGTCRACSLKAKRNRFGACSDHFNLKCHTEAVAWCKRKLESGDGLSCAAGSSPV